MPEKFFYTFLILFAFFTIITDNDNPQRYIYIGGALSFIGMIISAICWIWS